MRMKASRIRTLSLRRRIVTKDSEGVPTVTWGPARDVKGEYWPAGGQLQVQTYGDRVNNMLNVRLRGSYTITREGNHQVYAIDGVSFCEGDGLCIHTASTEAPDYRIISITPYDPIKLEVELI